MPTTSTGARRILGRSIALAAIGAAVFAGLPGGQAQAGPAHVSKTRIQAAAPVSVARAQAKKPARLAPAITVKSTQVAAPFNLALSHEGVLVADGGLNQVGALQSNGSISPIVTGQVGATGVAVSKDQRWLAVTTTTTNEETFENTASGVDLLGPWGRRVHADTLAYEKKYNPDGNVSYGTPNPSQCVKDAFENVGIPASYKGMIDSHAYSVVAVGNNWVVADAGANALFKVTPDGKVSTLAVLPAFDAKITQEIADEVNLPACVVGIPYKFESVPTDVEVGRDGNLYVTTLSGGPEGGPTGTGRLFSVNPVTGKYKLLSSGFSGATNLAIGSFGEVYVAEFYTGEITAYFHGVQWGVVKLPNVIALEAGKHKGTLWAATLDFGGQSTIVTIDLLKCGRAPSSVRR